LIDLEKNMAKFQGIRKISIIDQLFLKLTIILNIFISIILFQSHF
jgi:hypothetical protein